MHGFKYQKVNHNKDVHHGINVDGQGYVNQYTMN